MTNQGEGEGGPAEISASREVIEEAATALFANPENRKILDNGLPLDAFATIKALHDRVEESATHVQELMERIMKVAV